MEEAGSDIWVMGRLAEVQDCVLSILVDVQEGWTPLLFLS
jgi:hypothetical protein